MFLGFFKKLRDSKIPVSLNEFLTFIHLLEFDLVNYDINKRFDERDKSFDRIEKLLWFLYPTILISSLLI